MKPELIVMLTYNDQTVENSLELFEEVKDTPIIHWGFKDVGLSANKMGVLVEKMKKAGKTTYLEVVSLSEEEGLQGAKLGVELGFDILMGTVFYDSILDFLSRNPLKYYPFPGHVHHHPSILDGTIEEIVNHAKFLENQGVDGLDLLTYRYIGNPSTLLTKIVQSTKIPLVSAGSIESYERIADVWRAGAWGFTIGTAFFEKKFVQDGTFKDNVVAVWDWLQTTNVSTIYNHVAK